MKTANCERHGVQLFTVPVNDKRPSHCLMCIAAAFRLRPKSFSLTDNFKKLLEQMEDQ